MPELDLTSVPAWGLFALAVIWLVLRFLERARLSGKSKSTPPPSVSIEHVTAVVRDQQERREILDLLREQQEGMRATIGVLQNQTAVLGELKNSITGVHRDVRRVLDRTPSAPFNTKGD